MSPAVSPNAEKGRTPLQIGNSKVNEVQVVGASNSLASTELTKGFGELPGPAFFVGETVG